MLLNYSSSRVLLLKETMIHSVVDKFLFNVWGMKVILEAFCCTPGTVDTCAEQLAEGKILVRELKRLNEKIFFLCRVWHLVVCMKHSLGTTSTRYYGERGLALPGQL